VVCTAYFSLKQLQLQTFKDAVASLKGGNSLVAFAEGTRSNDGRLKTFKKVSHIVHALHSTLLQHFNREL
jgi:1-acyl-sn-glycerol-3-phosphate acyltransferase